MGINSQLQSQLLENLIYSTKNIFSFSRPKIMENKIYLFDTTLRDGQQTTGVNFSVSDKMIIAKALDELGVSAG